MTATVYVSFVHGFRDGVAVGHDRPLPTLWQVGSDGEQVHRYVFPFSGRDFSRLPYPVEGELPSPDAVQEAHPRFGFTGLARVGNRLFAGSWNGVYVLDLDAKTVLQFVTNRYTCYLHGIYADEQQIIVAMPYKDLVVVMDHAGTVQDRFMIDRSLRVVRDLDDRDVDWRFVNKPWTGTTGFFHFNYVQRLEGRIVLTSRNLGALVVVDPATDTCTLRTLNFHTPTCIHDGVHADGKYYFTSIDGKIIIAGEPPAYDARRFNYDLQAEHHRLDEIEKNWCRGIAVDGDHVYTTIDGRYDTDLSFKLLQLDASCALQKQWKFAWSQVGDESDIRFVTGFDIVVAG